MSFRNLIINPIVEFIESESQQHAFCIDNRFFTYKQFGEVISKIRNKIKATASGQQYIGLITNDDIETYASIFAIWMEGKAYIPLHGLQPVSRSLEIISQVNLGVVFDSAGKANFKGVSVVNTGTLENAPNNFSDLIDFSENELAYILFTSGTTGKPKGVAINRNNIASFVASFWATGIVLDEQDKCLQCFDLTFDVSVQSYLIPLLKGACVYTIPTEKIKYSYVFTLLEDHQLTFGSMAPSMLRFLKPYFDEIRVPSMKYCILTAEASPMDLIAAWHHCIPNAEVYDFYGPTEGTIYCTYYKVDFEKGIKSYNGLLSIGKPMDGFEAVIVDDHNRVLEKGQKGELCIAGKQLTPGYWKNEEKNSESFFQLNYNNIATRFYHTGDLCYIDVEGDLMYSGRIDNQAKIQGYRVELGEIEGHARSFLEGKNAIAIPFIGASGNTEIGLIIESPDMDRLTVDNYLRLKLPPYMIPTTYKFITEFPINTSGKIDRNKLKDALL
ncbi:AMP-binding protein [Ferruginibacter paludis]|uniref:AMP-binding protein n=1 Tax=Ferruginibacter paludis TaxID=1310417 RepID=UPI0025B6236D|nr:AMP-binding protein [Ferruginibacter paludis]MDN3658907.1 AMP-binding protein [Ferruginibacter paludis]